MQVVPRRTAAPAPAPYAAAEVSFAETKAYLSSREALQMSESDLERELNRRGQELLRKLLQEHLDQRSPGEAAGPVEGADGFARSERRLHDRQLETTFGTVTVERLGYARPGHDSLHPTARACGSRAPAREFFAFAPIWRRAWDLGHSAAQAASGTNPSLLSAIQSGLAELVRSVGSRALRRSGGFGHEPQSLPLHPHKSLKKRPIALRPRWSRVAVAGSVHPGIVGCARPAEPRHRRDVRFRPAAPARTSRPGNVGGGITSPEVSGSGTTAHASSQASAGNQRTTRVTSCGFSVLMPAASTASTTQGRGGSNSPPRAHSCQTRFAPCSRHPIPIRATILSAPCRVRSTNNRPPVAPMLPLSRYRGCAGRTRPPRRSFGKTRSRSISRSAGLMLHGPSLRKVPVGRVTCVKGTAGPSRGWGGASTLVACRCSVSRITSRTTPGSSASRTSEVLGSTRRGR